MTKPRAAGSGRQRTKRKRITNRALTLAPVTRLEDLHLAVVMLTCGFVETEKVDGHVVELWVKESRTKRPRPKTAQHLGTGFLVAEDEAAFLVTAAHVARRMHRGAHLSFAGSKETVRQVEIARLTGRARSQELPWAYHPTGDVAALRLARIPTALSGRFLPAAMIPARNTAPSGSLDLLVVGFPLGLVSRRHFSPITKRAHAASGIFRFRGDEMARASAFFLLDQPTMGGCSGGPVFVVPQLEISPLETPAVVEPRCVGLVSQTISDESGAQYAAVAPSGSIRRTLAQAAAG